MSELAHVKMLIDEAIQKINQARRIMDNYPSAGTPAPEDIVLSVSDTLGIALSELKSKRRLRSLVDARQICISIIRENWPTLTLAETGKYVGISDHSTVLHNLNTHSALYMSNTEYTKKLIHCFEALKSKFPNIKKQYENG